MSRYLAVGAHIGDVELTSGPTLAQAVLDGHSVHILALTAGERGHNTKSAAEYKQQKIREAEDFAQTIRADLTVFEDQHDANLMPLPELGDRVSRVMHDFQCDIVISHWKGSWHPDHRAAYEITDDAVFKATLPQSLTKSPIETVLYAENWEDADGFKPLISKPISDEAFERWSTAISRHEFARGESTGFRYIDYYKALMTLRGCLTDVPWAQSFMPKDTSSLTL